MKILLDECVTKKLKTLLVGHTVFTIGQMEWTGLKNGMLIKRAEQNNFEKGKLVSSNCFQKPSVL